MKKNKELTIRVVLLSVLILIVIFNLNSINLNIISNVTPQWITDNIPTNITEFQRFALWVNAGYSVLPSIVQQQFSISTITVQLLQTGFNPIFLLFFIATMTLVGQFILYVVGIFVKRIHTDGFGEIAKKSHFLHKYHFIIPVMIPFLGIVGDALMLYAGHQRINPVKLFPFIYLGNVVVTAQWIFPSLIQLEVSKLFGF